MTRDVFISYSRRNLASVMKIKAIIDRECSTECWIDLKGIESGSEMFLRDIAEGIDNSKVFLFMLSQESMESEYALLELSYAKKKGKRVVLVNIDDCSMNNVFLFRYSLTDTIAWNNPPQREKLLRDVTHWLGSGLQQGVSQIKQHTPPKDSSVSDAQQAEGYTIGDTIIVEGQKGVIFYLDESRKHGKVMSIESSEKQWCTREEYLEHRDTKTTDDKDGMSNMNKIQQIPDWASRYPAFNWCAKRGKGWYLPTTEDYRLINKAKEFVSPKIEGINETASWYWSSEQEGIYSAKYYHFLTGQSHGAGKDNKCNVIAIANF